MKNKQNKQDKSLVLINQNSIFYKIRKFLYNCFKKEKQDKQKIEEKNNSELKNNNEKERFEKYIKNIEDEETKLLKLQKMYRAGKIKEEELTQIQIQKLCDLYDKQIKTLRKTNEYRKQQILKLKNLK